MDGRGDRTERERRWVKPLLVVFGLFAATMLVTSATLLSHWTDVRKVSAPEAEEAFEAIRARHAPRAPFLSIDADGTVSSTRSVDPSERHALDSLHLLSWDPAHPELVETAFPYWFVRLKLSDRMNLGTLVSLLARDWEHMDLRVTERDLEALGPTLLLDHRLAGGRRLMLWTE